MNDFVQFETTWGLVKCQDGTSVWFPRFFGEGIASVINRRKTFVMLSFDKPINHTTENELIKERERSRKLVEIIKPLLKYEMDTLLRDNQSFGIKTVRERIEQALKEYEVEQ